METPFTTTTSTAERKTVRFNVGGRIYEVSRSLLDEHPHTMLARLASDTWSPKPPPPTSNSNGNNNSSSNSDGDRPLFIERDRERFGYCLDYMRNGEVSLPPTISKTALLRDLDYYGFDKVDTTAISEEVSFSTFTASVDYIDSHIKDLDLVLSAMLGQLDKGFAKVPVPRYHYFQLAMYCLVQFKKTASLRFEIHPRTIECVVVVIPAYGLVRNDRKGDENRKVFNEVLKPIGLKLSHFSAYNVDHHLRERDPAKFYLKEL